MEKALARMLEAVDYLHAASTLEEMNARQNGMLEVFKSELRNVATPPANASNISAVALSMFPTVLKEASINNVNNAVTLDKAMLGAAAVSFLAADAFMQVEELYASGKLHEVLAQEAAKSEQQPS